MLRREFLRNSVAAAAAAMLPPHATQTPKKALPSVLGSVTPDQLGITLPHEHIAVSSIPMTAAQKDGVKCIWDLVSAPLKQNGVRSLVDLTPEDSGRDVLLMKEVSVETGLNILCATGYYLAARRPANFLMGGAGAAEAYMTRELVEGIGDTGVRAAVIKLAVGDPLGNRSDTVMLEGAARAQKQTGVAISTHATSPDDRRFLAETLEKYGADMSRVAIGHADTNATLEESIALLSRVGYVLYTIWGITNPKLIGSAQPVTADHSARLIRGLLDKGLAKQIMFSIDFAPYCLIGGGIDLYLYEIPRRTSNYAFTFVLPLLRKLGVSEDEIQQIMVTNPRRHLFGS